MAARRVCQSLAHGKPTAGTWEGEPGQEGQASLYVACASKEGKVINGRRHVPSQPDVCPSDEKGHDAPLRPSRGIIISGIAKMLLSASRSVSRPPMMLMLAGAWQGQRDPHCDLLLRKGTCIVLFGKGAAAPPLGGASGRSGSSQQKEPKRPQNCGSRKLAVWQLGIFAPMYICTTHVCADAPLVPLYLLRRLRRPFHSCMAATYNDRPRTLSPLSGAKSSACRNSPRSPSASSPSQCPCTRLKYWSSSSIRSSGARPDW